MNTPAGTITPRRPSASGLTDVTFAISSHAM